MKRIVLITGGCRSGKSRFALNYANRLFTNRLYLATSQALDDEMAERITRHKMERSPDWRTIEEPIEIEKSIYKGCTDADVILLDCLTLWISNLLGRNLGEGMILESANRCLKAMQSVSCSFIVVTNEVGAGIVPDNRLSRQFRDAAGAVNQIFASCANEVYLLVSGIPLKIK